MATDLASMLSISSLFDVSGRIAVVTGGSSGIGLMISKGLVINGAKVYILALRSDPIVRVVEELNSLGRTSGGKAIGFACDLSSKEGIEETAQKIAQREEKLDILISNAGIRRDPSVPCDVLSAPLEELQASMWSSDHKDWRDSFQTNTTAHYFLSVALLPLLAAAADATMHSGVKGREEGRGVIVITSSCASMHNATNIDLTSYAASKAATDHLVKLLAAKYQRFYVRVVSINPGFVPSNMNPIDAENSIFRNLFDKVPAKRAGNEADMAGTVLYLVSRAGAYVNGVNLAVDGGRLLLANGQE